MADGPALDAKPQRRPIRIDAWARWVAGIIGVTGFVAGGTATFTRDVEAGPVALIAVGALFLIVSLAGFLPTRLKVGDNEAEWLESAGEALADVTDLVPTESRAQAASVLETLARTQPEAAAPAIAAFAYEQVIFSMLYDAVQEFARRTGRPQLTIKREPPEGRDRGLDGLLVDEFGRQVAIEVKAYSRPLPAAAVEAVVRRFRSWDTPERQLLFISRTPFTSAARELLTRTLEVTVTSLVIEDPSQQEVLNSAIESLFTHKH